MRSPHPLRAVRIAVCAALLAAVAGAGPAASTPSHPPAGPAACQAEDDSTAPAADASVRRHLVSGGLTRSYITHLPEGYRADRTWPLVLVFHGRGSSAAATQEFSGLDTLPAVVVYADGVVGTGTGDRQAWEGAPYSAPGVDDVGFVEDLIDQVGAEHCVDERRVYATGKSNGAGFVGILGCELSDRIAAIAPVAGAFYDTGRPGCTPARSVPVIEIHGTQDVTIPYLGDADRRLPSIPDWIGDWAERNGCRGTATHRAISSEASVTTHRGCRAGATVAHLSVAGGGHTWPGADAYSGGGHTTQTFEASQVIWDFVRTQKLPR